MRSLAVIVAACALAIMLWLLLRAEPELISPRRDDATTTVPATEAARGDSGPPIEGKAYAESGIEVTWMGYVRGEGDPPIRLLVFAPEILESPEVGTLVRAADGDAQGAWREILARKPELLGVHVALGDDRGAVRCALPPGSWGAVLLEPDGHRDDFTFRLVAYQTLELQRTWPARIGLPAIASGRVLDAGTGRPLEDARVVYTGRFAKAPRAGDRFVSVGPEGHYEMPFHVVGFRSHGLAAFADGYLAAFASVVGNEVPPDGRVKALDFLLHPRAAAGTIHGRVLDAEGAPARDAEIRVVPASSDPFSPRRSGLGVSTRSGPDGRFRLYDLPPRPVDLTAALPLHRKFRLTCIEPAPDGVDLGDLGLERASRPGAPAHLSGSVRNRDGAPVSRLEVRVQARGLSASELPIGHTDDVGAFEIEEVPPGDHNVHFSKPGLAVSTVRLSFEPGARVRYDHRIPGGSRFIGGRVTAREEPLADVGVEYELPARVAADHDNPLVRTAYASLVTRTDAGGRFRLEGLVAGEASLTFSTKEPWSIVERDGLAVDRDDHEISFPPAETYTVRGAVSSVDGVPIKGAVVGARASAGGAGRARTGPDGRYELRMPVSANIYSSIYARSPGFVPASRSFTTDRADDERVLHMDFVLVPRDASGSLDGRAHDVEGRAASRVQCTLAAATGSPPPEWTTSTDSRGRFAFRDLPAGSYRLTFVGAGWQTWRETLTLEASLHTRRDVELERVVTVDAPVTFVLENEEGRNIAGAELFVAFRSAGTTGVTDAAGRYTREDCKAGRHVVYVTAPGYLRHAFRIILPGKDPDVRLVIRRGSGVIRGRIEGSDGTPRPHVTVVIRGGDINHQVTSDGDGHFAFENLPDERFQINCWASGSSEVQARPGDPEITLTVQ